MNSEQLRAMSEKIRDHLTAQKARSTAKGICSYRGYDNTSCAIGCLIPDDRYNATLEGYNAGAPEVQRAVLGDAYDDTTYAWLNVFGEYARAWQAYHDCGAYRWWCAGENAVSPSDFHSSLKF